MYYFLTNWAPFVVVALALVIAIVDELYFRIVRRRYRR